MDIAVEAPCRAKFARAVALAVVGCLAAGSTSVPPVRAQTSTSCNDTTEETPESYGPTDINAVSGNQRLSVGLNRDATVTVMKWPSPSYYDQIKYKTTDRSEPRMGALPNEGAFLGVGFKRGPRKWNFAWLRDWASTQRFADDDNDEVVSVFRNQRHGLRVAVRDVVAHDRDALTRWVKVKRTASSPVTRVRVISFANFNPVFSKRVGDPSADWCTEGDNDDGGRYDAEKDAIVHERTGTDTSTGQASGSALAMGFVRKSNGFEVGVDTYQTAMTGSISAYDDAGDAKLSGNTEASGQADGAIADDIVLRSRRSGATAVHLTAGHSAAGAMAVLDQMRARTPRAIRRSKSTWWARWLRATRLPNNAPPAVVRLAKRSLIATRQATDRSGLIVASIATQPPLGVDWIRNGAYINRMLHVARRPALVRKHNIRYAQLQARAGQTTPAGNWAENYYADGVVGGPRSYEIDQTGLGIWTLWDHFEATGDRSYLFHAADSAVYEAIQRAAHYLSDNPPIGCRDPATGLHCAAYEEGSTQPQTSIVGAQAIWLGLGAAVAAAEELATDTAKENAEKWRTRRAELRRAIAQTYLDAECRCYTRDYRIGGTTLWPVRLVRYGSRIANGQARMNWRHVRRAMNGKETRGGQEARALLGNAYAWHKQPRKMRQLKRALQWVATATTTDRTQLLGDDWMRYPRPGSRIVTMSGQPHVWNHAMFYLAATKAYGTVRWSP